MPFFLLLCNFFSMYKMKLVHKIADLTNELLAYRNQGKVIGLVPTMGALHDGHAFLVKNCIDTCDITVVSIFVNPTQFNNKTDLELYPRTLKADSELLETLGVDVVFAPTVDEMYPEPDTRVFDFGMLDKVMEGKFRAGHFNGVALIVSKLFMAVEPAKAFFGEKDYQQLVIVREMTKQLDLPVEIISVPIVREKSGLAMSSRNTRLTDVQLLNASEIFKTLQLSVEKSKNNEIEDCINFVVERINNVDGLDVEYFEIVDGHTLLPVTSWNSTSSIVGCIAVFCGDVRLIDNIRYK